MDGKLIRVCLADGTPSHRLHSLVYTFGRPVAAGAALVAGDQNGAVRRRRRPVAGLPGDPTAGAVD
jgi:hypothetical protein